MGPEMVDGIFGAEPTITYHFCWRFNQSVFHETTMMNPTSHGVVLPAQMALAFILAAYLIIRCANFVFHPGSRDWFTACIYGSFTLSLLFRMLYAGFVGSFKSKYNQIYYRNWFLYGN